MILSNGQIGTNAYQWPKALLAILAMALLAAPLAAQNAPANNGVKAEEAKEEKDREKTEAEAEPDPNDPITVDFVKKDIHTVMHYIALRSGLQIIVEGTITAELTVMYRKVLPKDAIRSICKANELEYVEDGNFIIIKRRQNATAGLANVVKGDAEGRFNVAFESQELVAAIMEVAKVTQTPVFVPTVPQQDTGDDIPGPRTDDQEARTERRIQRIQERRISMYMRNADPEAILKRLADVGALKVVKNSDGYYYDYMKVVDPNADTGFDPNAAGGQVKMVTRDYVLPGVNVLDVKGEITNLLSPRGKVVVDRDTNVIMVSDREEVVNQIDAFLTKVGALAVERKRLADEAADDPMMVVEISLVRDANAEGLQAAMSQVLTADGRISTNPETNSVIIYERRSRMDALKKFVAGLDTMPQQVLISARLVEVSLESYIGYGLQLFSSQPVDSWKDGVVTGSSRDDATGGTVQGLFGNPTGFSPFVGTFVNQVIDARLELLANDGKVKTLSQPTQMVSNRRRARIEVGQEIPYVQTTSRGTGTGTTTATVTFREVSIVMEVQPTIFEGGIVRLEVTVTVREVIGNAAIEGNNTPVLSLRESQTDVYMRDGETMVMGGLLRERERMDENGLPFLKDIPFVGYLFKSANKSVTKTDLMFFLRPTIINTLSPDGRNEYKGVELARDLTPVILDDADADLATLRNGNHRKLGKAAKPAHYNENTRPKKAADVKPGA
ncbi:MAG: hypothetical protein KF754_04605 [Planctomycetes bacterium]|nr:hypothetical protein [Planctomycetota bacterium]